MGEDRADGKDKGAGTDTLAWGEEKEGQTGMETEIEGRGILALSISDLAGEEDAYCSC